jgi:cyclohexanecarboxylate-CoA ligase
MKMSYDAAKHAQSMRSQGFWIDKSFDEFLQATVAATPDKLALLAYRADRPTAPVRLSYGELADRVARAAASLKRLSRRRRRQPAHANIPGA